MKMTYRGNHSQTTTTTTRPSEKYLSFIKTKKMHKLREKNGS